MTPDRVLAAIDGTWPPARMVAQGPWILREGRGGGQRVSAATARGPVDGDDLDRAEAWMRDVGQPPLFMIRPEDAALDRRLESRGYALHDAVQAWACAPETLCDVTLPRLTVFPIWEPLAIMREIWAAGGIGPGRIEVMDRAAGPKTALLGRLSDRAAAVAFLAMHDGVAMLHALEVVPARRRQGLARWMMHGAAQWARGHGADTLAVLCTQANEAANGLYRSLSMTPVTTYHYRRKPEGAPT